MVRRDLRTQELLQFLHWFADPLVGRETWRANQATTDVSDILTVCDEAYIYLTIESNYDKWLYLHQRTVSTTQTTTCHTKPLLTHMDVHDSRNKRWPTGHTAATTQIVQRQNTPTGCTWTQKPSMQTDRLLPETPLAMVGLMKGASATVKWCTVSTSLGRSTIQAAIVAWRNTQWTTN